MNTRPSLAIVVALSLVCTLALPAAERTLSRADLIDKIAGFWIGQLAGNYMGFPFENVYVQEPCPFMVDRYYTWRDDLRIRMNRQDLRGFVPILAAAFASSSIRAFLPQSSAPALSSPTTAATTTSAMGTARLAVSRCRIFLRNRESKPIAETPAQAWTLAAATF